MMLARMNNLPAIPEPGEAATAALALRIENDAIRAIPDLTDIADGQEWLAKARAWEAYLKSREMQAPVRGALRRVEARIGQLLGAPTVGNPNYTHADNCSASLIKRSGDRVDFRLFARALDGECPLVMDEWRKSRRALVKLLRERLGIETPYEPDESQPESNEDFLNPSDADEAIVMIAKRVDSGLFAPSPGILACLKDAMSRVSTQEREALITAKEMLSQLLGD